MNPENRQYSRKEKEMLIWKNKHPDYRSTEKNQGVMVPADMREQYGVIVNLSDADDELIDVLFKDALRVKVAQVKRSIFLSSLDGNYDHIDQGILNQWSSSFDDMKTFINSADLRDDARERAIQTLQRLEAKFYADPAPGVEAPDNSPSP